MVCPPDSRSGPSRTGSSPAGPSPIDGTALWIQTPSTSARVWIEQQLAEEFHDVIVQSGLHNLRLAFTVAGEVAPAEAQQPSEELRPRPGGGSRGIPLSPGLPPLHPGPLRGGPLQPAGLRRRQCRGGEPRQVEHAPQHEPTVRLRRLGPGQDPPDDRHRQGPAGAEPGSQGGLPEGGQLLQRTDGGHQGQEHRAHAQEIPAERCPAAGRCADLGQDGAHPGGDLLHPRIPAPVRKADRHHLGQAAPAAGGTATTA